MHEVTAPAVSGKGEVLAEREITPRGFRVFGSIPTRSGVLRVQESSLAFEGPHVWLFHDGNPQLDIKGAKLAIAALQAFVDEAERGELTEAAAVKP